MDKAQAAIEKLELYFAAHPGSPSAVRRPVLSLNGKVWTALLGPNLREGIAGFGPTVEAALRDFDAQYLNTLRPPESSSKNKLPRERNGSFGASDSKRARCRNSPSDPFRADFLRE
jgi:hypothetical protein